MRYNRITLSFPEKEEKLFLKDYFFNSILQFRIAIILLTFLYGIFGCLDSLMFPEYSRIFHIIRYLFVVPLLSVVFLLSFTRVFRKIWQVLLLICCVISGAGISIMIMFVPENFAYYGGVMLVFLAGYLFIKLRFFLASIAGWATLILFNIGAIFYAQIPNLVLINYNFFFITTNIVGMFAAYNIEYYARRNFFLNLELQRAKEKAEESEAQLKELNATKDKLFSIIAHDLRSPFNSILGFSELLIENINDFEIAQSKKLLGIINSSAKNTLVLLDNLLAWAKSQTGQIIFKPEKIALSATINEIIEISNANAKIKNITLNYLQSDINEIYADKNMFMTIIRNLITNAIKFTNSNGKIDIYSIQNQGKIEIAVSDNGIGMNEETRNKLFSLDTNLTTNGTANEKGSGLGLVLCKEFVEKHGGKIWVESTVGKGSDFRFTMPLNQEINND